ncbi:hypothetical protein AB205_0077130 [Aquarana catesbeiana]|uniref:Uncharacterized protein n=1 Tax=Aquarana catesbeiana TaxID=8400 RepID=A0A2G9S2V4_AQUCT|nr:hypothetical protein AB205_0077130 [Aquarana catesbeiana]
MFLDTTLFDILQRGDESGGFYTSGIKAPLWYNIGISMRQDFVSIQLSSKSFIKKKYFFCWLGNN